MPSPPPESKTKEISSAWEGALAGWEKAALWGFLALVLAFGGVIEMRSAFLKRRMTDADVFFRAGWAVREGLDLYTITDTNGWHYNYPPLFAIAMVPLASPPPGESAAGMLPYRVLVGLWFLLSVGCIWVSVQWLANVLERAGPAGRVSPRFSRRWWALRLWPILLCLMAVGRTLSRGQSNPILLLLFCGMIALLLERRSFRAGVCLAGAICIKIFPAFLVVQPVLRRDLRCLLGVGVGLFCGLVLVPLAVLGPAGTAACYRQLDHAVLRPSLRLGDDTSRALELTTATHTGSQSFMVIMHNTIHLDRSTRPMDASATVRAVHWLLSALVTAITLAVGWRRRRGDAISKAMFLGALIVIMLPISPICHVHYFIFAIPLVMTLLADAWERHPFPWLGRGYAILFTGSIAADIAASLPFTDIWLRDLGVPLYATLALWGAGIVALRRRARV